ncbi:hypothetical protein D3C84_192420 [compost metagenome]
MASTPAVGPRPTARTNSRAQTISGTLRRTISRPRTGQRSACAHQAGRPPRCSADSDSARLASRAPGMAISRARAMPAVAMARVSRVARPSNRRNSRSCASGQKSARKRPILAAFCSSNSSARFSSLSARPGHNSSTASRVRARRGRAAGSRSSGFSIAGSARSQVPARSKRARLAIVRWRTAHPARWRRLPRAAGRRRYGPRARR